MSGNVSKKKSQTDWVRVDSLSDEDIDTSDISPLDEEFFANAEIRLPQPKVPITIRMDPDVLAWFKSLGRGYQTHINAVLRKYMEARQQR